MIGIFSVLENPMTGTIIKGDCTAVCTTGTFFDRGVVLHYRDLR